ncbi:uncharacterized protein IUM83_19075 [Phytophthora cinnamomi]|uniref:uncharacterized protein n=1 Tax=Phytophthora cinnamomi TaxID=4785 RepID=UPI0035594E18|nr:hypothetical protein IUM83_19075 [Phytophthora cinnamomi]
MSLASLRAVKQQLALAVEAAEFHVEVAANLDACPQDDRDQIATLSNAIEHLQAQLQTVLATVLVQSNKRVAAAPTPMPTPPQPTDEVVDLDTETETEEEIESPEHKSGGGQHSPKSTEELATSLQTFVQATGQVLAQPDTGKKHRKASVAVNRCRSVTGQLVALMESGGRLDDASACLFRDTVERLAGAAGGPQVSGQIPVKFLVEVVSRLGRILELADAVAGTPAALSSAELRSSRLKLKKYAEEHMDDTLAKMRGIMQAAQKRKGDPVRDVRVHRAVKTLAANMAQDISMYYRYQEIGLPERSEERWAGFTEVAGVLGDWIGRIPNNAVPTQQLRTLTRFVKKLRKEFPDRLPAILLKNTERRVQQARDRKGKGSKN